MAATLASMLHHYKTQNSLANQRATEEHQKSQQTADLSLANNAARRADATVSVGSATSNVRVGGARSTADLLVAIGASYAPSATLLSSRLPPPFSGVGGGLARACSSTVDLLAEGVAPLSLIARVGGAAVDGADDAPNEGSSLVRSTLDERASATLACAASTSGDVSLPSADSIERTELLVVGVARALGTAWRGVSWRRLPSCSSSSSPPSPTPPPSAPPIAAAYERLPVVVASGGASCAARCCVASGTANETLGVVAAARADSERDGTLDVIGVIG